MAGIYGILLKDFHQVSVCDNFYNSSFRNTIQEEITVNKFRFGRSVLNKFNDDRFLYENDSYVICFEGINYSHLKKPQNIIDAYENKGKDFIKTLKGTFSVTYLINKKMFY